MRGKRKRRFNCLIKLISNKRKLVNWLKVQDWLMASFMVLIKMGCIVRRCNTFLCICNSTSSLNKSICSLIGSKSEVRRSKLKRNRM